MDSFINNSKLVLLLTLLLAVIESQGQNKTERQSETEVKERPFQISLVPGFGTSKGPKEGYTNQFSLNIFAGYEHSLDGAEFGGFYNINKTNVAGAQFAGFGNTVGGNARGAQFAGFLNTVNGKVRGLQSAGFLNVSVEEVHGAQLAGYMNLSDSIHGVQAAGLLNVSKKSADGVQLAGLANWASDLEGVQAAGLVNRARHVKGTQIGLINIADTVERGVTVGLINIVKKGKLQFALEHNEAIDFNIAFRSGTNRLYSVLFVGAQAKEDYLWTYGGGFGTEFKLKKQWNSSIELTTQSINPKDDHYDEINLLNRLSWNFGYQFANHLAFSAGPVLNIYVTEVYDQESGRYGNDIDMGSFYNETFSGTNVKMWVGYNVSVKF